MIVKVTQEHIDKASKEIGFDNNARCSICPVAQALRDTFKVNFVFASYEVLTVGRFPDNLIFEVETPLEVFRKMSEFDNKGIMEPFEFDLSLEGVKL